MRVVQQGISVVVFSCLILAGTASGFAQATPPAPQGQAITQSPEQIDQLVAPIALYPDGLIAQILAAATYPDQIVAANQWLQQHGDLQGQQLADAVNQQPWDPSVKALVQFPAVLKNMGQNLAWTSELGDAYVNQQAAINQAIQNMRQKAKQAGNLNSTPQQNVTTEGNNIVIQPTNPEVVYVPQYDPWLVYGYPIAAFPGWYPYSGLYIGGPGIGFGLGFNVGFFGGFGWGWHNWGYGWHPGGGVFFNHGPYFSHSTTIVNRNNFVTRNNFNRSENFNRANNFNRTNNFNRENSFRAPSNARTGAFSGFRDGGASRMNSFRGQSSFGGFRGGGGGGFHGGGGGHGGGRR